MITNELRIGNFVYANVLNAIKPLPIHWQVDSILHGNVGLIKTINDKHVTVTVDLESIDPIPVTEGWLKNFGFDILDKQYSLNIGCELYRYAIMNQFVVWKTHNSCEPKIRIQGDGWMLHEHYHREDVVYKYVHQIQNLYYILTGKELKIL